MIKKLLFYLLYITIIILLLLNLIDSYQEYNTLKEKNIDLKKNLFTKNIMINDKVDITNITSKHKELESQLLDKYQTINLEDINKIIEELNNNNESLSKDLLNLNEQITKLTNQKEELSNQYNILKNKREEEAKSLFQINNVPTMNQYPKYPTGCESVALYILLKYYNVNVTVDEIINNLDKGDLPYTENGIKYGGNPYLEFIGNPYSSNSYGTYDYAISKVANQYKSGIINGTGKSLNEVLQIVRQNRPVLVWTSISLALPYISNSWQYKPTGETINWYANEHAVVIAGYNNSNVIISDPISGDIKLQNKDLFEQRYNYYGKRNLYY